MTRRDRFASHAPARRAALAGLAALAPLAAFRGALAQPAPDWPTRPVRAIVPFPPGSTPDIVARLVAEHWSANQRQPMVVENRAGAGGNIGTLAVARAAPDGYTVGLSITGPLVNNTVLYAKLPYDPFRELAPITLAATQPSVLAVSPTLGVDTPRQFLELLRRSPGKFNYASLGNGTVAHLAMELIKARTGTYIVHIPYGGSPAAVTSILQGDTHMAALPPAAVIPQVRAGRLKALAVTSATRFALLPELPTFREVGIADVEATAWSGYVAPAGVPAPILARLHAGLTGALRDPGVGEKLRAQFMEPVGGTSAEFAEFMRAELARWTPVIRRAGVVLD